MGLVCANLVRVPQGKSDLVESVKQTVATKRVDIESFDGAVRQGHLLLNQVDGQFIAAVRLDLAKQTIDDILEESTM